MHSVEKMGNLYLGFFLPFGSSGSGAQSVTKKDYQRAEQFLGSNVDDLVYRANVNPRWADKKPLSWYSVDTRKGEE